MIRRLLMALACAVILPMGVRATAHAGTVRTSAAPPTDIWVNIYPADGKYIRGSLFIHSDSSIGCSAKEISPKTGYATSYDGVESGFSQAGKEGTIEVQIAYLANTPPAEHAVKVNCGYVADSGTGTSASFTTTYYVPRKSPTIVPPPHLQVWVDPSTPTYKAYMSLYAKTDPGTLCSAYLVEGDTWYSTKAVRVGKSGIAQWHWHYSTDGTGYVTCDGHKQYVRAQADYYVIATLK